MSDKTVQKADKAQEFVDKYNALVKEYGYQLLATPAWKLSQDTGVFSLVLQMQVAQIPQEKN